MHEEPDHGAQVVFGDQISRHSNILPICLAAGLFSSRRRSSLRA
jgi:hypothetical protein